MLIGESLGRLKDVEEGFVCKKDGGLGWEGV